MPDEVKPPATETPTTPAPQVSAPADNVSAIPAPTVEAGAKSSPDVSKREVTGLRTDLFKARFKARSAEDSVNQINNRLSALEAKITEASRAKPDTDPWAETQAGNEVAKDPQNIEGTRRFVRDELNNLKAELRREGAVAEANNWLLSREHLRADPNAVKEMEDILNIPDFAELLKTNPRAAARAAYVEWCEQRGVVPDIGKLKTDTPTDGAKPTASKKVEDDRVDASSLKEVRYGTPEYDAKVKAIEQAAQEGKFKGNVIKIR
jgi:uncharacterized small protein (DUF1192 family)